MKNLKTQLIAFVIASILFFGAVAFVRGTLSSMLQTHLGVMRYSLETSGMSVYQVSSIYSAIYNSGMDTFHGVTMLLMCFAFVFAGLFSFVFLLIHRLRDMTKEIEGLQEQISILMRK